MCAESVRDAGMPHAWFATRPMQKIRIGDAAEEENEEERVWVQPTSCLKASSTRSNTTSYDLYKFLDSPYKDIRFYPESNFCGDPKRTKTVVIRDSTDLMMPANDQLMAHSHHGTVPIPDMPSSAQHVKIFPDHAYKPLLSLGQLADTGYTFQGDHKHMMLTS